jgi:methyl-accepting chemotaxis protein
MDAAEKQFDADLAAGRKPLLQMRGLDKSAEGTALIDAAARHIDAFEALDRKAFALARAGQRDAAQAIMQGEAAQAYSRAMDALANLVKAARQDIGAKRDNVVASGSAAARFVVLRSVAGMLIGFGALGLIAVSMIARPIARAVESPRRLAEGDLDVAVTGSGRRDEVGALARALSVFRDQALRNRQLEAEQTAERAACRQIEARRDPRNGGAHRVGDKGGGGRRGRGHLPAYRHGGRDDRGGLAQRRCVAPGR